MNNKNWRVTKILRRAEDKSFTIDEAREFALDYGLLGRITLEEKTSLMAELDAMVPAEPVVE